MLEKACTQAVFHLSWNQSPSQACWFHEKWNAVLRAKQTHGPTTYVLQIKHAWPGMLHVLRSY